MTHEMMPIFVGGTGRSATTLIRLIYGRHPSVAVLGEARLLVDAYGLLDLAHAISDRWDPFSTDRALREFRQFAHDLSRTSRGPQKVWALLDRLGVPISRPRYSYFQVGTAMGKGDPTYFRRAVDEFIASLGTSEYSGFWSGTPSFSYKPRMRVAPRVSRAEAFRMAAGFWNNVIGNSPLARGKSHWVDDSPFTLLHADELFELFPAMKIVHARRHPFDIIASMLKQWWGPKTAEACAIWIRGCYERWEEVRSRLPAERVMEISLEEIAADYDGSIRRLALFAGIDPQRAMRMDCVPEHHHIGRHREELSDRDRETAARELGRFLDGWPK